MAPSQPATAKPIRVVIQQPALPKYRIPVFAELARRPSLDVRVIYAEGAGMPNAAAQGFSAQSVPMATHHIGGHPIYWHAPQWTFAAKGACDVLVLSWDLHYASLIPALLRARRNAIPTILWGHGISKTESSWRSWPQRKVTKLATALLFYNHTAANRYIEQGIDPRRIFVALNALDQTPIQQARQHWLDRPEELAAFGREHGLDKGPVALFVSRLGPERRLDLLLKATARLTPTFPDLKVMLIGEGEHQAALQAQANSMGIADRVRFIGAIYDEMRLAPWFLSADAFVFPSFMGLSLLHAFGYGLPVITSNHLPGHGPEIEALRDNANGLLYAHDNPDLLAAAMRRLFDNAPLKKAMSTKALKTATEQFTLDNMVNGFEAGIRFCAKSGE